MNYHKEPSAESQSMQIEEKQPLGYFESSPLIFLRAIRTFCTLTCESRRYMIKILLPFTDNVPLRRGRLPYKIKAESLLGSLD